MARLARIARFLRTPNTINMHFVKAAPFKRQYFNMHTQRLNTHLYNGGFDQNDY